MGGKKKTQQIYPFCCTLHWSVSGLPGSFTTQEPLGCPFLTIFFFCLTRLQRLCLKNKTKQNFSLWEEYKVRINDFQSALYQYLLSKDWEMARWTGRKNGQPVCEQGFKPRFNLRPSVMRHFKLTSLKELIPQSSHNSLFNVFKTKNYFFFFF